MKLTKSELKKLVRLADALDNLKSSKKVKDVDFYTWLKKNEKDVAYSYETGGKKVPERIPDYQAEADLDEYFDISDPTPEQIKKYRADWTRFAKEYRAANYKK